ncbi:MAG: TolC family protein [Arcobacter sp.]|jgi:outer membrane protein TolC|uniref:TolC family protein n=1 Tax=Arcobacter sp. TaxID=1872629 RepID=UPI00258C6954|nr:TolC family protein [Arcobacter sp.]MDD3007434.1 TolC family protein [Arcobacter sp.]MDY3204576.1 TolC family protein [Arcobacter sp.]
MLKIILTSSLTLSLLSAISIDELVNSTFENSYDLKSVEKSIEVANHQISIAKKWQNPILSMGINDLWINDFSSRNKEAMQASFIGISQVIPTGDKLEIKEKIASKEKNIKFYDLEDKKLELESKINELVYNILLAEEKYRLLEEFEKNLEKLESLYGSLYKYQKATQNEIINSQISTVELKIQKQNLKNLIDNSYLKLEQITYTKIDKIDEKLEIKKVDLLIENSSHPKFKSLEENSSKQQSIAELERAKKIPDVQVSLAYFQRDDKFTDYVNMAVSIPLPIYDTENVTRVQAKMSANETNDKLEQLKHNFDIQSKILKNNLNNAYENYNLIGQKIIPLKEKIQKNIETFNTFDDVKPQESIKNLNELITYQIKAIDEQQKYYEAYSGLIYYSNKGIK